MGVFFMEPAARSNRKKIHSRVKCSFIFAAILIGVIILPLNPNIKMKPGTLFKSLSIAFLFSFLLSDVNAQVQHSIGATLPFGLRSYEVYDGAKNTDAYYLAMFSYGFRCNLSQTENSSFSIGPLISAGGGMYNDGYGGGILYSGDLQAWADYNLGMGAVADPPKNTGVYFGLGFGGSYTGADGESVDDGNGISFGPMARAGFRFGVGDQAIGVGLYYKHGIETAKWRTFGFHVLVDL